MITCDCAGGAMARTATATRASAREVSMLAICIRRARLLGDDVPLFQNEEKGDYRTRVVVQPISIDSLRDWIMPTLTANTLRMTEHHARRQLELQPSANVRVDGGRIGSDRVMLDRTVSSRVSCHHRPHHAHDAFRRCFSANLAAPKVRNEEVSPTRMDGYQCDQLGIVRILQYSPVGRQNSVKMPLNIRMNKLFQTELHSILHQILRTQDTVLPMCASFYQFDLLEVCKQQRALW